MLKSPLPIPAAKPLASTNDEHVKLELAWVIVRDGPGSWASHVDWDEYLLTLENLSDQEIRVVGAAVHDSLGIAHRHEADRSVLVDESRLTAKRYRKQGLKTEAGMGAAALLATGAGSYVAGSALGIAVLSGSAGVGAAGIAVGAIVAAPAIAVGGVVRGIRNSRIAQEIERRGTRFPLTLPVGGDGSLDLFFSLAPDPRRLELTYETSEGRRTVLLEPLAALSGLHLEPR